jgi:hypothetical protein
MKTDMYKDIIGIEEFYKSFPNKVWHYFGNILEFRYYKNHENYEWYDKLCVDLKLSDLNEENVILLMFRGVTGGEHFELYNWISGLDIIDLHYKNTGWESHFEIIDFEDSHIHFYCDEVEVKVISVNGESCTDK